MSALLDSLAVSNVIEWGLSAAGVLSPSWSKYFYLAVDGWLVVCLVALIRGWTGVTSRLLLGSAVALFFAVLPNLGPLFAIRMVADSNMCKPESTGCLIFGGEVRNAYGALEKANLAFLNGDALPMVGILVVFSVFAIVSGTVSGVPSMLSTGSSKRTTPFMGVTISIVLPIVAECDFIHESTGVAEMRNNRDCCYSSVVRGRLPCCDAERSAGLRPIARRYARIRISKLCAQICSLLCALRDPGRRRVH